MHHGHNTLDGCNYSMVILVKVTSEVSVGLTYQWPCRKYFWLVFISCFDYLNAVPWNAAGRHQDEWQDQAAQIYNYITFAIPGFVFLILGLWLFGFILGWFPISGSVSAKYDPGTIGYIGDRLYHMILPAVLGAVLSTTGTVQYLRTGIIDNKVEVMLTARSRVPKKFFKSIFT